MVGADEVDTNSSSCIDVSRMIANLHDIKTSYERVDLGGVIRKFASNFEFVDFARESLIREYNSNRLKSHGAIAVYTINNDWTYTKVFECPLDFASFSYDSYKAKIGCVDTSTAALIKANKTTQYEYPVSELKDNYPLHYDGVKIRNEVSFELMGDSVEGASYVKKDLPGSTWWWFPQLYFIDKNEVVNKSFVLSDQQEGTSDGVKNGYGFPENNYKESYFAECISDCVISVDFSSFVVTVDKKFLFVLFKITPSGVVPLTSTYTDMSMAGSSTYVKSVKWSGKMLKGEKLQYAIFNHTRYTSSSTAYTIHVRMQKNKGTVVWNDQSDPIDIDVITPYRLLSRILSSINADGKGIYCSIKDTISVYDPQTKAYHETENERLKTTLIAPAESIRGMDSAKVYASFDKFCNFMEAEFGYVYTIGLTSKVSGPTEGLSYDILGNYVDFEGFTSLGMNITSLDVADFTVKFSTTDKVFLGISNTNADRAWAFNNYERFQVYIKDEGYRVYTDKYYHDTETDIFYFAVNDKKTYPGVIGWSWISYLYEYEFSKIYASSYSDIKYFGEVLVSIDGADAGNYSGDVSIDKIVYVRTLRKFMYHGSSGYFGEFNGSSSYNVNGKARKDMMFIRMDNKAYVIVGTSLVGSKEWVPSEEEDPDEKIPIVIFKHRDEVFSGRAVKSISVIAEPEYEVAGDRMYSEIQVGYEKQDYDLGNNGNDEFNFSNIYTTGVTLNSSKLSLISPFRADCYGFEEMTEKRGEDTSSTDSDQQTFIVKVSSQKVDDKYMIDRSITIEGAYTDTVFNAYFAPVYMIEANKRYLGSFTDALKFASSEGNSSIKIGGKPVSSDIQLDERLLKSGNITVKTSDFVMSDDWDGATIRFEWDGSLYEGYLYNADVNLSRNNALSYKLLEK